MVNELLLKMNYSKEPKFDSRRKQFLAKHCLSPNSKLLDPLSFKTRGSTPKKNKNLCIIYDNNDIQTWIANIKKMHILTYLSR